jgi:capsule biosynthesis phosphatase
MKQTFIMDIDGTICQAHLDESGKYDYVNADPFQQVIDKVNQLYEDGHTIILFTARGMRTHKGNVKKIKELVLPVLEDWLKRHEVKYHEIQVGKPWGPHPIYVDDRCLSIKSFANSNPEFFENIIKAENTL